MEALTDHDLPSNTIDATTPPGRCFEFVIGFCHFRGDPRRRSSPRTRRLSLQSRDEKIRGRVCRLIGLLAMVRGTLRRVQSYIRRAAIVGVGGSRRVILAISPAAFFGPGPVRAIGDPGDELTPFAANRATTGCSRGDGFVWTGPGRSRDRVVDGSSQHRVHIDDEKVLKPRT